MTLPRGDGPRRKLTRRERDVLLALCAPLAAGGAFVEPASSREVAEALGVSEAAVKQHLLQLYDKFAIDDGERRRTRLANKAVAAGVVATPAGASGPSGALGTSGTLGASGASGMPGTPGASGTPGTKHGTQVSTGPAGDSLAAARQAAHLRNWPAAFEHLSRLPSGDVEDSADAQELLGDAAMWSGRPEISMAARHRAYALHVKAGQMARAGVVALQLVVNHVTRNQGGQASGWLAKARRHLEGCPDELPRGHLVLTDAILAMFGGDLDAALSGAAQALAVAERVGDADLRALSLSVQGYALSVLGRQTEAQPKLDEAMADATSGELGPFATGFVYCRTVCASLDVLDFQRALEWTDAIERARADACTAGFPGDCRAHRASVYVMRGDWEAGEREARVAAAESQAADLRHAGIAQNEIGIVRLRSGDLAGAEHAFLLAHQLGYSPQPGLALLLASQGEHQRARALVEAAIEQTQALPLRGKLLAALCEIALAGNDLSAAKAAHDALAKIAGSVPALRPAVLTAGGVLSLAKGDARTASDALRAAVAAWLGANAPYEAACARVDLARALVALGDRTSAALELGAARPVLEALGAKPVLARAEAVLR